MGFFHILNYRRVKQLYPDPGAIEVSAVGPRLPVRGFLSSSNIRLCGNILFENPQAPLDHRCFFWLEGDSFLQRTMVASTNLPVGNLT